MKFLVPLLVMMMTWLLIAPPNDTSCQKTVPTQKTVCHKAGKCTKSQAIQPLRKVPSTSKTGDDCCAGGACNPFQVCVYCGCLPTEKIHLPEPVISSIKNEKVRLGYIIAISHFAGDFFHPPEERG